MSVDYSCVVFYGVILEPEIVETTQEVTRYNELTGEPYQTTVKHTQKKLGLIEWDEASKILSKIHWGSKKDSHYIDVIYNYGEMALGIVLASADMCDAEDEVDLLTDEAKAELKKALDKFGITEEPRTILWFQCN